MKVPTPSMLQSDRSVRRATGDFASNSTITGSFSSARRSDS